MIFIMLLCAVLCAGSIVFFAMGDFGIGSAYLALCGAFLCIANDREELKYLRNEVKKLNEAQSHR